MMMIPGVRADLKVKWASRAKMLLPERTKSFSIFVFLISSFWSFVKKFDRDMLPL